MTNNERVLEKRLKTLDRALIKADEKGQKRRVKAIRQEMAALREGIKSIRLVTILLQKDDWEG